MTARALRRLGLMFVLVLGASAAELYGITDYNGPTGNRFFGFADYRNGTKTVRGPIARLASADESPVTLTIENLGNADPTNQGIFIDSVEFGISDDRQVYLQPFGGRVMIGTSSFQSSDKFVVNGPFRIMDTGTKPACSSSLPAMFWYDAGGAGVKDTYEVCAKDAANVYAWRTLY